MKQAGLEEYLVTIDADTEPLSRALRAIDSEAEKSLANIGKLGDRLSSSFASAIARGDDLRGVLRSLLSDLATTTLRSSVSTLRTTLLDGIWGGLFGRAGGGSVSAGVPYLVGERGAEVFTPSTAGRIESAGGSVTSPAVGSVSITIDARGADAGAAERLRAAAGEIEERTFNAVFAAMNRGGRYARMAGRR